jgi:hypothetical protein
VPIGHEAVGAFWMGLCRPFGQQRREIVPAAGGGQHAPGSFLILWIQGQKLLIELGACLDGPGLWRWRPPPLQGCLDVNTSPVEIN